MQPNTQIKISETAQIHLLLQLPYQVIYHMMYISLILLPDYFLSTSRALHCQQDLKCLIVQSLTFHSFFKTPAHLTVKILHGFLYLHAFSYDTFSHQKSFPSLVSLPQRKHLVLFLSFGFVLLYANFISCKDFLWSKRQPSTSSSFSCPFSTKFNKKK